MSYIYTNINDGTLLFSSLYHAPFFPCPSHGSAVHESETMIPLLAETGWHHTDSTQCALSGLPKGVCQSEAKRNGWATRAVASWICKAPF